MAAKGDVVSILLDHKDIWRYKLFPYVGPGKFMYIAPVCRQWKDAYKEYGDDYYQEHLTIVAEIGQKYGSRPATGSDTIHDMSLWSAAHKGEIYFFTWVLANGLPLREGVCTCNTAAAAGNLELLEYAHQNGCPWDASTCANAAFYGQKEALKYCHENGCPWDAYTCSAAASTGRLDILKYARKHGCPWDYSTCQAAIQNGHKRVFEYIRAKGCPTANGISGRLLGKLTKRTTRVPVGRLFRVWGKKKS